jgi:formylglycine-generating enzyme required for sulfatase activity
MTMVFLPGAMGGVSMAQEGNRKFYAVVVGVSEYDSSKLSKLEFASKDAGDLEQVLKQRGYEVRCLNTERGRRDPRSMPDKKNIEEAVEWLVARRKRNETILLALSGHGTTLEVQSIGKRFPFFCPSDTSLDDTIKVSVETGQHESMVNVNWLMERLGQSGADDKLIIMDACRDVLQAKAKNVDSNDIKAVAGVAVIYGCKSGQCSYEFPKEKNGYLTHWLLKAFNGGASNPDGEIDFGTLQSFLSSRMRKYSKQDIQNEQEPKFLAGDTGGITLAVNVTKGSDRPVSPNDSTIRRLSKVVTNGLGMQLCLIRDSAGDFEMGSPEGEEGRKAAERLHPVRISRPYYMGATEVTQKQYRRVMGENPSAHKDNLDGDRPVEQVTYWEAARFCKKLGEMEGKRYRLPTEAEWEWACRAKSGGAYSFGNDAEQLDDYAVYDKNSAGTNGEHSPDPVGKKQPNKFGLYDMHGNVSEWVADWAADYPREAEVDPRGPADGKLKVHRGGSFENPARLLRSANREAESPDKADDSIGFRVVLETD